MTPTSDSLRRTRLPRDERIQRILTVTRELLAEKGYDRLVTSEIAERCGLSDAAIYKYFDGKRDLLIQVAEKWYEEMLAEDHRSVKGMTSFEALRHVIWRYFSIVKRHRELTRFMLLDLRPDPTYRSMPIYKLNRKLLSQIPEVLRACIKSGDLRGDVPLPVIRDMIFGAIEHQTWAYLRHEGDFSIEESTNNIVLVLLEGLRAPGARAPMSSAIERLERLCQQLTERLERAVAQPTPSQSRRKPR